MTGHLVQFSSANFEPNDTEPLGEPATLSTLSETGRTLACADYDGEFDFVLWGGAPGSGPLRIDPVRSGAFVPTLLASVARSDTVLPGVPVFGPREIRSLFDELGVQRSSNKGQVVILVSTAGIGQRTRVSNVRFQAEEAAGVGYLTSDGWSRDARETDDQGLGVLYDVTADEKLGAEITVSYRVGGGLEREATVQAANGAVTFFMLSPN